MAKVNILNEIKKVIENIPLKFQIEDSEIKFFSETGNLKLFNINISKENKIRLKKENINKLLEKYQPINRIVNNYTNRDLEIKDVERMLEMIDLLFYKSNLHEFKLEEVKFKNYKKYENSTFQFKSQFTLLVGENATGKTTILDGLATTIGGFLQGFENINSKMTHGISTREIRTSYLATNTGIKTTPYSPVEVIGKFKVNNTYINLKRNKKNLKSQTYLSKKENMEILSFIEILEQDMMKENKLILPIFSYHGTGRLWEQEKKRASKMELLKRIDGYNESLEAKSNYRNFLSWFEKLARSEFSMKKENPVLNNIRKIIIITLEELTEEKIKNIDYRENDLEIYYKQKDEIDRVGQMSDGYRNIIGLVSDIAYRICLLNPDIKNNITETPGIILIDEVDLHLHPKWQRKIVGILKRLFPKIQFIVSSHSPFIIQSMEKKEIIRLDDENTLMANGTEMSIEDISENIMGLKIPQMSERKKKMLKSADEYFNILEKLEEKKVTEEEAEKYKNKLDKLSEPFEDNIAYVAFLKRKRLIAESKMVK